MTDVVYTAFVRSDIVRSDKNKMKKKDGKGVGDHRDASLSSSFISSLFSFSHRRDGDERDEWEGSGEEKLCRSIRH